MFSQDKQQKLSEHIYILHPLHLTPKGATFDTLKMKSEVPIMQTHFDLLQLHSVALVLQQTNKGATHKLLVEKEMNKRVCYATETCYYIKLKVIHINTYIYISSAPVSCDEFHAINNNGIITMLADEGNTWTWSDKNTQRAKFREGR